MPRSTSLANVITILHFWGVLPDPVAMPTEGRRQSRDAIGALSSENREMLIKVWERQYDEVRSDIGSIRSRAAGLMGATGIISGVVTVGAPLIAPIRFNSVMSAVLAVMSVATILGLLYSALGTVVLSIRAQQIGHWTQAEVHPRIAWSASPEAYRIEYAHSLYWAWWENVRRIANYAGYLLDAQLYFRIVIALLALLIVLSLVASVSGSGSPSPSLSHAVKPVVVATAASSSRARP